MLLCISRIRDREDEERLSPCELPRRVPSSPVQPDRNFFERQFVERRVEL